MKHHDHPIWSMRHGGEMTAKLLDLNQKHNLAYDRFEYIVRHLNKIGAISEQHTTELLERADEMVETGMDYSAELGKVYTWRWFFPTYIKWRFSKVGRDMMKFHKEQ